MDMVRGMFDLYDGLRWSDARASILVATLALTGVGQGLGAQSRFPRDTISPHYARVRDELPAILKAMSSVLDAGLDSPTRDTISAYIQARQPRERWHYRSEPGAITFLVDARFRGTDLVLPLFLYWSDTSVVGLSYRTIDTTLISAFDSVLLQRRVAPLVKPSKVTISVQDGEGYNGAESSIIYSINASTPHCPGYGLDKRERWINDTLFVQVFGVPPVGLCPNLAGRGGSYRMGSRNGRFIIAVESRGDSNFVALDVTDSTIALVPLRTTYVEADGAVKQRVPSASITLTCHREVGDPRLCDAMHEFVLALPGVRFYRSPPGTVAPLPGHFEEQRVAIYRYSEERAAAKIRRCVSTIPPQTRMNSWLHVLIRPTTGRWWGDGATGSSNSGAYTRAAILGATGSIPSTCGDSGVVPLATTARYSDSVGAVSRTTVSLRAPMSVHARSNGWVELVPLDAGWPGRRGPSHLYARASDAARWAARVQEVFKTWSITRSDGESATFIPALGVGTVTLKARVTDSRGRAKVSVQLNDCAHAGRQYDMDAETLAFLAHDVAVAAGSAGRASPEPRAPTLAKPYNVEDVSCAAFTSIAVTVLTLPDSSRGALPPGRSVRVRFAVDTAGHVEPESISLPSRMLVATADVVRTRLLALRYRPAELARMAVRQYVDLEFTFR